MTEKLKQIEQRYYELGEMLSDPATLSNPQKLRDLSKEHRGLEHIVRLFKKYEKILNDIESDKAILAETDDPELREIAQDEIEELQPQLLDLQEQLKFELIPTDPNDSRNAIIEIRAGTGGDEAGLFAGDLFRMYSRYAERQRWKVDVLSSNPQGIGGFKEIIALVEGDNVFGKLKFEGGVHRVQRVPTTETSGRIHTSAATVAVLPEAEDVDIEIAAKDLRIDVFRSSGPGGQSVNTTDSAVRITHIPTGMVVTCQDEKSQHKNKAKALKVLRSRLLEQKQQEEFDTISANRRKMVSTGDRSAKIRTYNFPQGRITDHRIHFTLYRLDDVLDGNLTELLDKLIAEERLELLKITEQPG
jgi:peptide chain release factor 1